MFLDEYRCTLKDGRVVVGTIQPILIRPDELEVNFDNKLFEIDMDKPIQRDLGIHTEKIEKVFDGDMIEILYDPFDYVDVTYNDYRNDMIKMIGRVEYNSTLFKLEFVIDTNDNHFRMNFNRNKMILVKHYKEAKEENIKGRFTVRDWNSGELHEFNNLNEANEKFNKIEKEDEKCDIQLCEILKDVNKSGM